MIEWPCWSRENTMHSSIDQQICMECFCFLNCFWNTPRFPVGAERSVEMLDSHCFTCCSSTRCTSNTHKRSNSASWFQNMTTTLSQETSNRWKTKKRTWIPRQSYHALRFTSSRITSSACFASYSVKAVTKSKERPGCRAPWPKTPAPESSVAIARFQSRGRLNAPVRHTWPTNQQKGTDCLWPVAVCNRLANCPSTQTTSPKGSRSCECEFCENQDVRSTKPTRRWRKSVGTAAACALRAAKKHVFQGKREPLMRLFGFPGRKRRNTEDDQKWIGSMRVTVDDDDDG